MTLSIIKGNIFNSDCQTIVNTVNCVGVMGAGIALECRLRYPEMYTKYISLCDSGMLAPGKLWLYKGLDRWILNFPTKQHWRQPSYRSYLEKGLEKFALTFRAKEIRSIAFPLLGADKGGLNPEDSLGIMRRYLSDIPIQIEIYKYDPRAKDDKYDELKKVVSDYSEIEIADKTGIKPQYVRKLMTAMNDDNIVQLNQLARVRGIGIKTLEKIFGFMVGTDPSASVKNMEQNKLL